MLSKIFADSSSIDEIESLKKLGFISGITTNPLIVAKEAGNADPQSYYQKLALKFPDLPISIQLLDKPLETLLQDAKNFANIAPNIVVKIPMFTDGKGLVVLSTLSKEGIKTNVTGMMTAEQLMLALITGGGKGPNYVSLFFNRIRDGGGNPELEIQRSREFINRINSKAEIIAGSIRRGQDVFDAAFAGAHIVTVTPKVIWQMIEHPKSVEFINQCQNDWDEFVGRKKK